MRAGVSVFAQLPSGAVNRAIDALRADLETGRWQERHRELLTMDELHLGYYVFVAEPARRTGGRHMKVIGAGLPRTGTLSQKVALEMLGFGPCYHMVNVLTDLPLAGHWEQAMDTEADWDEIFGEHESTVDWPGSFFYRELADAYPDAKVVLSVRDPEAWERSMHDTIWGLFHGHSLMAHISKAREDIDPDWRAYMQLMRRMWAAQGVFSGPELRPGTAGRGHHPLPGAGPAEHPRGPAAGVERRRRAGSRCAASSTSRCRDAEFPRLNDSKMFVDRIIDGSLMVVQPWREAGGVVEAPARQAA